MSSALKVEGDAMSANSVDKDGAQFQSVNSEERKVLNREASL